MFELNSQREHLTEETEGALPKEFGMSILNGVSPRTKELGQGYALSNDFLY